MSSLYTAEIVSRYLRSSVQEGELFLMESSLLFGGNEMI